MGRLTVRLPNALHTQLETLARSEGVSLNQYLVYALTRQATLALHHLRETGKGVGIQQTGDTPEPPPGEEEGSQKPTNGRKTKHAPTDFTPP